MTQFSEMRFKSRETTAGAKRNSPWFAWTLIAVAALLLSNAVWFYNWRERDVIHAEAIRGANARQPESRVVYEYRDSHGRSIDPPRQAGTRMQDPGSQSQPRRSRPLEAGEECRGSAEIRVKMPHTICFPL